MNNLYSWLLFGLTLLVVEVVADTAVSPVSAESTASSTVAPTAAKRGHDVFLAADQRLSGFGDMEVGMQMILRTAQGRSTERSLRIRQLEVADDGDRVMLVFDKPLNIRGTALLSHGHIADPDDQWLFLPAIKRVKKIASRNKSGPFVGSEFSFEDLRVPEVEKYTYLYVRDEVYADQLCHVVQRVSKEEFSGYARELFWIDQEHLRTLRVDYLNSRDDVVKTLAVTDFELYDERWWKAGRMHMSNLRTGKSTELVWHDYQFGAGLSADRDFSVNSLRRAR